MIIATAGRTMYALGALTQYATYTRAEIVTALELALTIERELPATDPREAACERAWREYCATHTLPDGIPANPDVVYASEWRGWCDWIGQRGIES